MRRAGVAAVALAAAAVVGGGLAYATDYRGTRSAVDARAGRVWDATGAPVARAVRALLGGGGGLQAGKRGR